MAGVSEDFPIHQWHELIPPIVLTLNLLRQSLVAPNILAYAYHQGNVDYNQMPLAPMGCAVQFHIKPNRRKSWGEHASDGWYLKISPVHYRCHWILIKATRAKQISVTVFFKHKYIRQPTMMTDDLVIKANHDLTIAIKGNKDPRKEAQSKAITKFVNALRPGNEFPIQQASEHQPRVQQEQVQEKMSHLPLILQECRLTHLQGCGLTSALMKSKRLI